MAASPAPSGTPLPIPADRTPPPALVARVCVNGHLATADLSPTQAGRAATNRADPLTVATTGLPCTACGAGTIVGCPGCGYPIPGGRRVAEGAVPHFCVVCGEYYPWTYRGEFYVTLAEIVEESGLAHDAITEALRSLGRLRDGVARRAEVVSLTETFRSLGGSDWDLAAQILAVVLPDQIRRGLDLRGAFAH